MRSLRSAGALVIAFATGCSLFVDIDKLGKGQQGAAAGLDDAGVDDAGAGDAGVRFCERAMPKPDFCADFDGEDIREGWENASYFPDPFVNGDGKLEPESPSRDGSRAVAAMLNGQLPSSDATLFRLFQPMPRRFDVAFDVKVTGDQPAEDQHVVIMALAFQSGPEELAGSFSLSFNGKNGLHTGIDGTPRSVEGQYEPSPVDTGWRHVDVFMDVFGRDPVGEVYVDGTRIVRLGLPLEFQSSIRLSLLVGAMCYGSTVVTRVTLDNVTFKVR